MGVDTQQLRGFDSLAAKLREIPKALRRRVLRNALAAGGRIVRDEARRLAPVLQPGGAVRNRTPGLVRNQLSVRTSKRARQAGDVGVFINVRPAQGAKFRTRVTRAVGLKIRQRTLVRASERGANSARDPFYWKFLEFGTKKMRARSFLRPAAAKLPQALTAFQGAVGRWVAKVNATGQVSS